MPAHPLDSSLQIVSSIVDSWMSKTDHPQISSFLSIESHSGIIGIEVQWNTEKPL